jgi:hypothetical protein
MVLKNCDICTNVNSNLTFIFIFDLTFQIVVHPLNFPCKMCRKVMEVCDSNLLGLTYIWHVCCMEGGQELVFKLRLERNKICGL